LRGRCRRHRAWARGVAALPLALAAACAAGVAVPLLGARDALGFFASLATAAIGGSRSTVGIALARRFERAKDGKEQEPAIR
jgi:hypothetical protein